MINLNKNLIQKNITVDPDIQHGKPCLIGTRTPIHVILEALAVGLNLDQVKKEFDPISDEQLRACVWYAALLADEQELSLQTNN